MSCLLLDYNEDVDTRFASIPETSLIPIIKRHFWSSVFQKGNTTKDYSIQEEFRSQYGIPDLLFYNFDNKIISSRLKANVAPVLSKNVIKTLLLIQGRRKVSLSFLRKHLKVDNTALKNKILKYLVDNNYLNKSTSVDSYFVGENSFQMCMDNLFAIEAKVSNWKRGFYQAYRYKWFSNYSFLALHKRFANPAYVNLHLFKQYNIGLVSVDTSGKKIDFLYEPRKQKPYSKEMAALTYERLFANYLEKKATSQLAQSSRLII